MRLLALDASTEACSAALLVDGRVIGRYEEPAGGQAEQPQDEARREHEREPGERERPDGLHPLDF